MSGKREMRGPGNGAEHGTYNSRSQVTVKGSSRWHPSIPEVAGVGGAVVPHREVEAAWMAVCTWTLQCWRVSGCQLVTPQKQQMAVTRKDTWDT